jgi:hypothetical protein
MQLNSRTAGYTMENQVYAETSATGPTWDLATNPYQKAIAETNYTDSTGVVGSSCMQCIGFGSVWCSRTYAYLETAITTT